MILVSLAHPFKSFFHSILLWLDSIIYSFVEMSYGIFLKLANTNLFTEQFYKDFAQRIYAVLGVVMLFVIAYALLKALIDPDQLTKGDKGIAKLIPTFVTSLIIIGLLPTIFSFAYGVQNFILKNNLVGVLIFGSSGESDAINDFGGTLAYTTLTTFVNPTNVAGPFDGLTWEEISNGIKDQGVYTNIVLLTDAIADGEVTYNWFFSQAVGIFLVYLLITFCLDLGVRAVRLAFLQLIAPIPILMRVVPAKNELFKNWVKKTTSSFLEVFVRIFIMYMAVYFISNLSGVFDSLAGSGIEGLLIKLIIIMGILMFVKEFPKLLQDITGIDSGNIKLGIKDFMGKLGAGGALGAAALLGAGTSALVRSGVHSIQGARKNFQSIKNNELKGWSKAAAITSGLWGLSGGMISSALFGSLSAGARAGVKGMSAQNLADMNKARTTALEKQEEIRNKREAYVASHRDDTPFIGAFTGTAKGLISDLGTSISRSVGWGDSQIEDNRLKEAMNAIKNASSNIQNVWKDSDAWKKADERLTRARGNIFKFANQTQLDSFNNAMAEAKESFLRNGGTAEEWNNMDHSNFAQAAGISDVSSFMSAMNSFNRAEADVKGIERSIQSQPNKQSQLQGALRMLGANMDKYADLRSVVMNKLDAEQTSLLNRIDLSKVDIERLNSQDKETLYGMLGKIKGNASDAIADVERRELFRTKNDSNSSK